MDVTATSGTAATSRSQSSATEPDPKKSALSSDFETFLKMLTTQMENQDPLNPMASTEFATQLATFSSVEQQTKTNELLSSMASQLGVLGMSQMAGWVGMEARTDGAVWVDNRVVGFTPEPDAAADRMAIVVYDEDGAKVARHEIAASNDPLSWLPVDGTGAPLPAGAYSFELESLSGGDLLGAQPLATYARILEAMNDGGTTMLVLEGGVKVAPADVSALRQPTA